MRNGSLWSNVVFEKEVIFHDFDFETPELDFEVSKSSIWKHTLSCDNWQGWFFFYYFLATSKTNWAQIPKPNNIDEKHVHNNYFVKVSLPGVMGCLQNDSVQFTVQMFNEEEIILNSFPKLFERFNFWLNLKHSMAYQITFAKFNALVLLFLTIMNCFLSCFSKKTI